MNILFKLVQPKKASNPIETTESGILMLSRLEHPAKHPSSRIATESGIVISEILILSSKEKTPIVETVSGITYSVSTLHEGYRINISPDSSNKTPSTDL